MRFEPAFIDEVKRRTSLSAVIARTEKITKAGGREFKALCRFHADHRPSMNINDGKGVYLCRVCGAKGDAITWLTQTTNATFADAVNELAIAAGLAPDSQGRKILKPIIAVVDTAAEELERANAMSWARSIWGQCVPLAGTLGEVYFNDARGVFAHLLPGGLWPAAVKFHPRLWHSDAKAYFPSVVAAAVNPDRIITGVTRIYLRFDGKSKAGIVNADGEPADKKMAGVVRGSAVRFGPTRADINIAEGLETALTVQMGVPDETVWSVLSLDNMGAVEFPDAVRLVTKWADNDEGDRAQAVKTLDLGNERHCQAGLRVRVCRAPDGHDWNSWHQHVRKQKQGETNEQAARNCA